MGRKSNHTIDEKIQVFNLYSNGESMSNLALHYDVNISTIKRWISKYSSQGVDAFKESNRNKTYTKELKLEAILAYINGEGSYGHLTNKYKISSKSVLMNWIRKYNNHIEVGDYDPKGAAYMIKTRKTTLDERVSIVKHCIENDNNYRLSSELFTVSYTQVYNWTIKYREYGITGLEDRRGKRISDGDLSETELLRRKVGNLERQLEYKERENILLKKVKEIERRRNFKK